MGPLDFTVVSLLLSSVAALEQLCKGRAATYWMRLSLYPVLSVVLPLFLPFLPNFIRTPQDCRPKIKVGLCYNR